MAERRHVRRRHPPERLEGPVVDLLRRHVHRQQHDVVAQLGRLARVGDEALLLAAGRRHHVHVDARVGDVLGVGRAGARGSASATPPVPTRGSAARPCR